jgi:hypothetical protein
MKWLHTVLVFGLLLALCATPGVHGTADAATAEPTAASTADSTALPAHVIVVFTEYDNGHTGAQVLTVQDDGAVSLEGQIAKDNAFQPAWKQSGKITQAQLDSLVSLLGNKAFGTLEGSYAPKRGQDDCTSLSITTPAKTVSVLCSVEQHYPGAPAELEQAVHLLREIRTPLETLITFEWSGGFAPRSTVLTIKNDGTATLEDTMKKTKASWELSPAQMEALRRLLRGETFARFESADFSVCSDCWLYTITAMTAQGPKTIKVDDAQMDKVRDDIKTLIDTLKNFEPPAAPTK